MSHDNSRQLVSVIVAGGALVASTLAYGKDHTQSYRYFASQPVSTSVTGFSLHSNRRTYDHHARMPSSLSARLPHLRIDVRITGAEGTQYSLPATFGDLQARFGLTGGQSVDVESVTANHLPLPPALENATYDHVIYSAVVINGCSSNTLIQLRGEVNVKLSPELGGANEGAAQLNDSILGFGNYGMEININDGGMSTHTISGKVPVYCTNSALPSPID